MSNAREARRLSLAILSTEIGFFLPCLTQMSRCKGGASEQRCGAFERVGVLSNVRSRLLAYRKLM